jgi:hypothetical protein
LVVLDPAIDTQGEPSCIFTGQKCSSPCNGGEGFHSGQKGSRSGPFSERIADHRQFRIFGNIPAEFIPDYGGFGAPETGCDEDRIGLNSALHTCPGPGDGEPEVRAPDVEPETIESRSDIFQPDIRIE